MNGMFNRKILFATLLMAAVSAKAQTTAEEIMDLLPKMPTEADMIRFHNETTFPSVEEKTVTQPGLYNDYLDALKAAKAQADERVSQVGDASVAKTMKSKVAGSDYTVEDLENMSEDEQEKAAMAMAQSKLASMGISLSDLPKEGEELSEAQRQALASKVMAKAKTGGLPQANPKLAELQMKLAELNSEEGRLSLTIDEPLKAAAEKGRALYNSNYKAKIDDLEAQKRKLTYAFMEKYTDEDRPRVEAESKKCQELTRQQWELECDFFSKYIPSWRKAVLASMNICKETLVPIEKQRQDVTRQLYELTQDANYTMGDTYPIVGAVTYLDQSGKLGEYEDYLRPSEEE